MGVSSGVSVCLSVPKHISITTGPNFAEFSAHVDCRHFSVLLWRRCNTLCTSGFVVDVVFSHNGPSGAGDAGRV